MKCPKCGMQNGPRAELCRRCGDPLSKPEKKTAAEQTQSVSHHGPLFWIICYLIMIPVAVLGLYKAYFWFETWRDSRPYTSGSVAYSQIEEIKMDYNKPGHAITIFGTDGDTIHIDELGQSYVILGGLVRIEVEDSLGVQFVDFNCGKDEKITVGDGSIGAVAQKLYDTLTGIQYGRLADENGWITKL